jgi:hypothetical protein
MQSRVLKGTLVKQGHLDQVHLERAYTTRASIELYVKGADPPCKTIRKDPPYQESAIASRTAASARSCAGSTRSASVS